MIVTVASRHTEITAPWKAYAEQKAAKLTKFFDRISEIEVVLDHANHVSNTMSVELIVHAEHNDRFVAHHSEGDAYACMDACMDKMERILTDHKKKLRNRKHPEA
jgi:ribosomal subunit interface protein